MSPLDIKQSKPDPPECTTFSTHNAVQWNPEPEVCCRFETTKLCIISPLFVCYRLLQWSFAPRFSPKKRGGLHELKLAKVWPRRIVHVWMFKGSSLAAFTLDSKVGLVLFCHKEKMVIEFRDSSQLNPLQKEWRSVCQGSQDLF